VTEFAISVILAESAAHAGLEPALSAIERSCAGLAAEVLVVRPAGRPPLPHSAGVTYREVIAEPDQLVPERWGLGVRHATAPVFACLSTEFEVHPEWATTLLDALADGSVGAAGAIDLAAGSGMTATAVYLVRFSVFFAPRDPPVREVGHIPGDGAAYRRAPVAALPELLATGFWEIEFHRRFLADGLRLRSISKSLITFHPTNNLRSAAVLRSRHGFEYGITRVQQHHHSPWSLIAAAPLVPFVLVARIIRKTLSTDGGWRLLIRSFPALVVISSAWAWGEATGAWSARGRR
jgi:hypothetical protein